MEFFFFGGGAGIGRYKFDMGREIREEQRPFCFSLTGPDQEYRLRFGGILLGRGLVGCSV